MSIPTIGTQSWFYNIDFNKYFTIPVTPFNVCTMYLPIRNEDILWIIVRLVSWCCPTSFRMNDKIGITGVDVVLNVKIIRWRLKYWIVLICVRLEIGAALKDIHCKR